MRDAFSHVAFADPAKCGTILDEVLETERPGLTEPLAEMLAEASSPDAVLVGLARYLEARVNRGTELDLMASAPQYTRMLVTILDQSHYLTDIVCRNPEYLTWLWSEADLTRAAGRDELTAELLGQLRTFDDFDAQMKSMRRFHRREILRIAMRDLFAHAPLRSVTADLSSLADACLEAALACAREYLEGRYGRPRRGTNPGEKGDEVEDATLVILAMGKLGGQELNFSSDIDLVMVYSHEGETTGGASGAVPNESYFQKLGERVIKMLSEQTAEGKAFRVDMRLRPYGRVAPLTVSADRAIVYYENVGQAWERQAMIKARPAAGDMALGEEFLERVRPFVFPRYFDDETLEEIHRVKQQLETQIEERGQTQTEVKLGRGGIRDIEFTVQILQLLNGGRVPELRTTSTLDAIAALGRHGLLRPLDANALAANYVFLRRVEHRLQIRGSRQIHALPTDPDELNSFAARLGYPSGDSFTADYQDRTQANRGILEQFLAVEGSGHLWVNDLLHPHGGGEVALSRLRELGFDSPERARDELTQLYAGPEAHPNTLRVRQQFTAVAPVLLESLASCGDPDDILMRLAQVLATIRAPGTMYDLLTTDPRLCEYLVRLVENSEYLTSILIQDPGLFDALGSTDILDHPATREELQEQFDALCGAFDPEQALYRLHAGEILRTGMRDLFRDISVWQVGRELTLLAEMCLETVLSRAQERTRERYGDTQSPFAVVGLGKLGGAELGYGSDLDLVFVYPADATIDSGMAPTEYFAAVASRTLKDLKERTQYGVLYDVDARLRPDGKKGVLAVSTGRLEDYYRNEAQAWERLALIKARAVAGHHGFCVELERHLQDLAFGKPFTPEEVANVAEVREKIGAQASPLDLKKDGGGIIEIEFLTRLLQTRHAAAAPELRCADVQGAVTELSKAGALSDEDAAALLEAYTLFRRVENRIRMARGTSGSALPDDPRAQADLARRLRIEGDLREAVDGAKARVHAMYREVLDRVRKPL